MVSSHRPFQRVMRTVLMCSPLALAACAGQAPAPTASPKVAAAVEPETGGIYKVGKPYQVEGIWYYPAEDYNYSQEGIASWYGTDFHGKRTANGDKYDMNDITAAHPTLPMPSVVKVTNLDNGRVLKVTVNDRGPFHSTRIIDVSRRAAQLLGFYEVGTARVRVDIDAQESMNLKNIALAKHPPEMPQIASAPRASVQALALDPVSVPSGSVKPVAVPPPASAPAQQAAPTQIQSQPLAQPAPVSPAPSAPKASAKAPAKTRVAKAEPPKAKVPTTGIFIQAGAFAEEANARKLEQRLGELGQQVHIVPTTVNKKKLYRVRLGPVADAATANALVGKIKSYGYNDAKVVRE